MKSLSKIFGVIISSGLLLAFSGCVVMDLEDPEAEVNYLEASGSWDGEEDMIDDTVWGEQELPDAELEQNEQSGNGDYGNVDDENDPADTPWPDPFDPTQPTGGAGG
jgi:hypothetical protein